MNLYILYSYCTTALKAASYFDDSRPIPPTLAFGLGSLGFLAPFAIEEARPMITRVLQAHIKPMGCTLRTRLRGEVYSRSTGLLRLALSNCSKRGPKSARVQVQCCALRRWCMSMCAAHAVTVVLVAYALACCTRTPTCSVFVHASPYVLLAVRQCRTVHTMLHCSFHMPTLIVHTVFLTVDLCYAY
eukprot:1248-Heterococcus_DN1.PRE.1